MQLVCIANRNDRVDDREDLRLDRGVDHLAHHRGDVDPDAIAFDEGDDRPVRHVQAAVGVHGDTGALRRHRDVFVSHDRGLRTVTEGRGFYTSRDQPALNCSSSVEPFIAVTEDCPAVTTCVTSSK